jgi:hypothetical protein
MIIFVSHTFLLYDSGRHDSGKLVQLKPTGPLALLARAIVEAKKESDQYLTNCINIEYGYNYVFDEKPLDEDTFDEIDVDGTQKKKTKKTL